MEKYTLMKAYPNLAEEWHHVKNGGLSAEDLTPNYAFNVWWQCKYGHEWAATVQDRTKGNNCPFCAGKRTPEPEIELPEPELVPESWQPESVTVPVAAQPEPVTEPEPEPETAQPEPAAVPVAKKRGGYRERKDLLTGRPDLAAQWHPTKNELLNPEDVKPGDYLHAWWQCEKGHEWIAAVCDRNKKRKARCPICFPKKGV